jgi:hypothetical protein
MNGRQLAEAARERRPGLKVLFITSFTQDAALDRDTPLAPGTAGMTKPIALGAFAATVRSLLVGREVSPVAGLRPDGEVSIGVGLGPRITQ